ncbi:MAG TPA: hypothetical protein VFE73_21960 [Reyranella sp.]|jgi:hypothetical protein|nr:hypothetical protein [Reyranella sp.]
MAVGDRRSIKPEIVASKSRAFPQLNQSTRELMLAVRLDRGLVLRAMIASFAHKLLLIFSNRRKPSAAS